MWHLVTSTVTSKRCMENPGYIITSHRSWGHQSSSGSFQVQMQTGIEYFAAHFTRDEPRKLAVHWWSLRVKWQQKIQHYRLCLSVARYKLWTVESQRRRLCFQPISEQRRHLKSLMRRKTLSWRIRKMHLSHVTVLSWWATSLQKTSHFSYPRWKVGQFFSSIQFINDKNNIFCVVCE